MSSQVTKDLIIGMVVEGETYDLMACINLMSIIKHCGNISSLYIITSEKNLICQRIAERNGIKVKTFEPRDWHKYKVPPMNNGSFTTYYKFDLIEKIPIGSTMLYLDTDTFLISDLQLEFIAKRFRCANKQQDKNNLLMVGSYRPVLEKIGYQPDSNPYSYYNAGVIFIEKNLAFNANDVIQHYIDYYIGEESLIWHDQDLINSFFSGSIYPLPAVYNLSTGWLSKNAQKHFYMNVYEFKKLKQAKIIHASGGILFQKKKIYPYRKLYLDLIQRLELSNELQVKELQSLKDIKNKLNSSLFLKVYNLIRMFFGVTPECSPIFYSNEINFRLIIKKCIRQTIK
jgi:lipopolysaccharide biosynthesis glycosyltransferase